MSEAHAPSDGWERMEYFDFLEKRRNLMVAIIRRGFRSFNLTLIPALTMFEGKVSARPLRFRSARRIAGTQMWHNCR